MKKNFETLEVGSWSLSRSGRLFQIIKQIEEGIFEEVSGLLFRSNGKYFSIGALNAEDYQLITHVKVTIESVEQQPKPPVRTVGISDKLKESLAPLFKEAREKGLYFVWPHQYIVFSPDDLEYQQSLGNYRWGPSNWRLIEPPTDYDPSYWGRVPKKKTVMMAPALVSPNGNGKNNYWTSNFLYETESDAINAYGSDFVKWLIDSHGVTIEVPTDED